MPIRCMLPGKDGLGREIATPNEACERLRLKGANKVVYRSISPSEEMILQFANHDRSRGLLSDGAPSSAHGA